MNNRIQELANQTLSDNDDYGWPWKADEDDLREFVALVVQESIVDFYRNYLDTTSDEDITVQVTRYIKDTFGVDK